MKRSKEPGSMKARQKAVVEQFNKDSSEYLSKYSNPENLREQQRIFDLVKSNSKYQAVLDIGCGPGTISDSLLSISDQVYGIDISKEMVRVAVERFKGTPFEKRIHFSVGDAEQLAFPDDKFDVVFCIGVLRYLSSWEKGLKEIYRVLKPGGVVVSTFYYKFSPHWFSVYFFYRPLLPIISFVKGKSFKECILLYKAEPLPFSYRKYRKILSEIGFKEAKIQHSGFDVFPINRLFPKLSRYFYLKLESSFFDSNNLGWVGSICISKGSK